ncbi:MULTISPECIES: MFS transporter [unclassified Chelatococcus]|uniref:MFS transporter n=1 Tax=unclassified Chelatococcus TaxID=2638111 RepID=UPI001BD14D18|nr:MULTISPECIES: MFS transporter [unclassified Chelatococcus]MBS7696643.1 MFS transporter [Chelatococcus sp. YT9]MBX3555208.1 MFS transporter [Chelatococcus sp.]
MTLSSDKAAKDDQRSKDCRNTEGTDAGTSPAVDVGDGPAPTADDAALAETPRKPAAGEEGLPRTARNLASVAIAAAVSLSVIDGTAVNIALPHMARDLNVPAAQAIWLVNIYQLAVTIALLPLSALGDSHGYKRVYCVGLTVFTLASVLCAAAPSFEVLLAGRAIQGLGAAGVMSVNFALVRFIYPPHLLGVGAGRMAVIVALSIASGPTIGASILSVASWHWLFLLNVPIGLFALVASLRYLPLTPRSGRPFDATSTLLYAVVIGLFIRGVSTVGGAADRTLPIAELAVSAIVGVFFVRRQLKLPLPLLPIDLLKRPIFSLSILTSISSFATQAMTFLALAFYLQDSLGWPVIQAGFVMTAWPVAVACTAPLAGRLADRYPPPYVSSAGLVLMTIGIALLAMLPDAATRIDILWRLAFAGVGFGLFQTPNNITMLMGVPRARSGSASGMQSSARLVGQTLGVAAAAAVFGLLGHQAPTAMLTLAACTSGLAAILGAIRTRA